MLLKFKVENFLSIKNPVEVDLTPSVIKELEENNVATISKGYRILKSMAIYGANSSGKSNILKALVFCKKFIQNSTKGSLTNELIEEVENFKLNTKTENLPSTFEIVFIVNSIKYRYGFRVDNNCVHQEWLYSTGINKEYQCFSRESQKFVINDKKFPEGLGLEDKTRSNSLFISVVAQFNGKISTSIVKWANNFKYILDIRQSYHYQLTAKYLEDPKYKNIIKKYLNHGDLGFSDINTHKLEYRFSKEIDSYLGYEFKSELSVMTSHKKYDENGKHNNDVLFQMTKNESLGTQKYFSLAGPIVDALINGKILIIDEFEARLHPLLCMSIIQLFNSKNNNPKNAQLIFVSHNTSFLNKNLFRRDQILLTQKDDYGATSTKNLVRIARNDEAYEKNYLQGEYDSIPNRNQLTLFSDSDLT